MNLRLPAPKAGALPGCATPRSIRWVVHMKGSPSPWYVVWDPIREDDAASIARFMTQRKVILHFPQQSPLQIQMTTKYAPLSANSRQRPAQQGDNGHFAKFQPGCSYSTPKSHQVILNGKNKTNHESMKAGKHENFHGLLRLCGRLLLLRTSDLRPLTSGF